MTGVTQPFPSDLHLPSPAGRWCQRVLSVGGGLQVLVTPLPSAPLPDAGHRTARPALGGGAAGAPGPSASGRQPSFFDFIFFLPWMPLVNFSFYTILGFNPESMIVLLRFEGQLFRIV